MANLILKNYGLKENPFDEYSANAKWLKTWVGRRAETDRWETIINKAKSGKKNYIAFIIGEYGRGKTLSLLKIVEYAKTDLTLFPIYLNFHSEQKPKNSGLDFLFRLLNALPYNEIFDNYNKNDIIKLIKKMPSQFDEAKNVIEKIFSDDDNLKKLAKYFITGQISPSKKELKQLSVIRKIDSVDIAKEYLYTILYLFRQIGIASIIFAIDEFEYLFSLVPKSQRTIYLALLRGLHDFPTGFENHDPIISTMTFFIAISEDGYRTLKDMESQESGTGGPIQPLFRRVGSEITLKVFDIKETRQLIESRLKFDRKNSIALPSLLIPFTEDYVEFVFEKSGGEIWKIIRICDHVLDAGLDKGIKVLNKKFAEQVIVERNL